MATLTALLSKLLAGGKPATAADHETLLTAARDDVVAAERALLKATQALEAGIDAALAKGDDMAATRLRKAKREAVERLSDAHEAVARQERKLAEAKAIEAQAQLEDQWQREESESAAFINAANELQLATDVFVTKHRALIDQALKLRTALPVMPDINELTSSMLTPSTVNSIATLQLFSSSAGKFMPPGLHMSLWEVQQMPDLKARAHRTLEMAFRHRPTTPPEAA